MKTSLALILMGVAVSACMQEMGIVGHLSPYSSIDNAPIAQALPEHTIPRGQLKSSSPMASSFTHEVLHRGQERYDIFCTPCHGLSGYGNGAVVRRGFPQPPSFHQQRLRLLPTDHFVNVIRNGLDEMPGFANVISMEDTSAIAGYIRALQLSQNVHLDDLPPTLRSDILRELTSHPAAILGHSGAAPGHTAAALGHTAAALGHTAAALGHTAAALGHPAAKSAGSSEEASPWTPRTPPRGDQVLPRCDQLSPRCDQMLPRGDPITLRGDKFGAAR